MRLIKNSSDTCTSRCCRSFAGNASRPVQPLLWVTILPMHDQRAHVSVVERRPHLYLISIACFDTGNGIRRVLRSLLFAVGMRRHKKSYAQRIEPLHHLLPYTSISSSLCNGVLGYNAIVNNKRRFELSSFRSGGKRKQSAAIIHNFINTSFRKIPFHQSTSSADGVW